MKTLSHRYRQANKEASYSVILALLYFVWWYGSAYFLSPAKESNTLPDLYFGFPLWFLMSCILGPLLFTGLCALMVKCLFKDMPLDIEDPSTSEENSNE